MTQRLDYFSASPKAMEFLLEQENFFMRNFDQESGVTFTIWELMKLRVSQINQCAYCIDMHSKDALSKGETHERLLGLSAWRDMPLYSHEERTALAIAEALSNAEPVDDNLFQQGKNYFGDRGLVNLTMAINAINAWNRFVKMFKPVAGNYQPN